MKTKRMTKRIGIRLEESEREKLEELINQGKFENISEAARVAIQKFLQEIPAT